MRESCHHQSWPVARASPSRPQTFSSYSLSSLRHCPSTCVFVHHSLPSRSESYLPASSPKTVFHCLVTSPSWSAPKRQYWLSAHLHTLTATRPRDHASADALLVASMSSSSPPEDPEYTSEPNILSPVSPKPIHFPTPDNIPVLQNQIDPAFNQMAAHIGNDAQQQVLAPGHADKGAAQPAQDNGSQDGGDGQGQSQDTANSNPQTLNSGFGLQSNALPSAAASALTEGTSDTGTQNPHTQTGYHAFPSQNPTVSPTAPSSEVPISLHDQANAPGANTQEAPGTQIPQPANGTDYQALLNSLQSSNPAAHTLDSAPSFIPLDDSSAAQNQPSAGAVDAASAGLPPRPPPQAQPAIHPNYSQTSDIRQYHPHASNTAQAAPNAAFQTGANGLPPPPVPSFQQPASKPAPSQTSPTTPNFTNHQFGSQQRDGRDMLSGITFDGEPKWDLATQKEYDDFLEQERQYVTEGNWEQFPYGSRLFVGTRPLQEGGQRAKADLWAGNLSSERVTKRDVFHVFHGYGKLAQISIKQAYGFVQFLNNSDCNRALHAEQGRIIRGKRISESTLVTYSTLC